MPAISGIFDQFTLEADVQALQTRLMDGYSNAISLQAQSARSLASRLRDLDTLSKVLAQRLAANGNSPQVALGKDSADAAQALRVMIDAGLATPDAQLKYLYIVQTRQLKADGSTTESMSVSWSATKLSDVSDEEKAATLPASVWSKAASQSPDASALFDGGTGASAPCTRVSQTIPGTPGDQVTETTFETYCLEANANLVVSKSDIGQWCSSLDAQAHRCLQDLRTILDEVRDDLQAFERKASTQADASKEGRRADDRQVDLKRLQQFSDDLLRLRRRTEDLESILKSSSATTATNERQRVESNLEDAP
ncbi:hypothetical protein [Variovorax sp. KK3]|uniref:hypothetical protein n=1 Tax=Variovorax sp. KK3 TaxID=1855728 RepID=UPI00097BADDF|nr:hypothetical protein [Variovorax sp. KK3]